MACELGPAGEPRPLDGVRHHRQLPGSAQAHRKSCATCNWHLARFLVLHSSKDRISSSMELVRSETPYFTVAGDLTSTSRWAYKCQKVKRWTCPSATSQLSHFHRASSSSSTKRPLRDHQSTVSVVPIVPLFSVACPRQVFLRICSHKTIYGLSSGPFSPTRLLGYNIGEEVKGIY